MRRMRELYRRWLSALSKMQHLLLLLLRKQANAYAEKTTAFVPYVRSSYRAAKRVNQNHQKLRDAKT